MNSCMTDSIGVMSFAENMVLLPLQRIFLLGIYCIIIFHGKCWQPSGIDNECVTHLGQCNLSVCVDALHNKPSLN